MGWEEKILEANGEWRIKDAEFKGYTKAQFDAIHETLGKIESNLDCATVKSDKNSVDISSLRAQAISFSVFFAACISGVVALAFKFIGG